MSNKSRQTLYVLAYAKERKKMRELALSRPCQYCKAKPGEPCHGINGIPAMPHWIRRRE